MASLRQLSTLDTQRGRDALGILLTISALFRFLEAQSAFEEEATDFTTMPVEGDAQVQTRGLGGKYASRDQTPSGKVNHALGFHGDAFDIDRSHLADNERNLGDVQRWIDKFLPRSVRIWAKALEVVAFNGDGQKGEAGRRMLGLANILNGTNKSVGGFENYTGVTFAEEFAAGANATSLDLSTEVGQEAFIEMMEIVTQLVDNPTGIMVNRYLAGRISTIARKHHMLGESRDLFGNPVPTFQGVPIITVQDAAITRTEPDAAAEPNNNTTSLYIAAPGEMDFSLATNSGLEFSDWDGTISDSASETMSERITWEVRCENKIEEKHKVRRVMNLKL